MVVCWKYYHDSNYHDSNSSIGSTSIASYLHSFHRTASFYAAEGFTDSGEAARNSKPLSITCRCVYIYCIYIYVFNVYICLYVLYTHSR